MKSPRLKIVPYALTSSNRFWEGRVEYRRKDDLFGDQMEFFTHMELMINKYAMKHFYNHFNRVKIHYVLNMWFQSAVDPFEKPKNVHFQTSAKNVDKEDFNKHFQESCDSFNHQIMGFSGNGSNYTVRGIHYLQINVARYKPLKKKRGLSRLPPVLPDRLKKKKCILNIPASNHSDNKGYCFQRAIIAGAYISALNPYNDRGIFSLPKKMHGCIWDRLWATNPPPGWKKPIFPSDFTHSVSLDEILKFEILNPEYKVIVIEYIEEQFVAVRNFKFQNENQIPIEKFRVIVLLLYAEHYFLVRHLSGLFNIKSEKAGGDFVCWFCFKYIRGKDQWKEHLKFCSTYPTQRLEMPKEAGHIEFTGFTKMEPHNFVFYADTEAYQEKDDKLTTNRLSRHKPYAVGLHLLISDAMVSFLNKPSNAYILNALIDDDVLPNLSIRKRTWCLIGEGCMDRFMNRLIMLSERIYKVNKMIRTPWEWTDYWRKQYAIQKDCYLCNKVIIRGDEAGKLKPVVDHNHLTGKIRGIAHHCCNAQYFIKRRTVPVFFHNLKGYDAHIICKSVAFKKIDRELLSINPIAQSSEKYISLDLKWKVDSFQPKSTKDGLPNVRDVPIKMTLLFLDSFQFLGCSLAGLMRQLYDSKGTNGFPRLHAYFEALPDKSLLLRKGVFPHAYIDSMERLCEPQLPDIDAFHSDLGAGEDCPPEDYEHAKAMWDMFECINIGEFGIVYLVIDVLGLADIFENFRDTSFRNHGLDPAHFYTAPGLCWTAALKQSAVKLEKILDFELYNVFERGIRGGLTVLTKRHVEANNKEVDALDGTSNNGTSNYLLLLDANGLYSWAMTQYLPTDNIKFLGEDEIKHLFSNDLDSWPATDGQQGYVLEVDLDYPPELHDKTASYPLAPAHETVAPEDLSLTQLKAYVASYSKKIIGEETKLIASVRPKKHYITHYRTLLLYLRLGLKVEKIHNVIQFDQSPWLKSYINHNIERRIASTSLVDKDFFKLCNNSVFGKTQEQKRKRRAFKLATNDEDAEKYIRKPTFDGSIIYTEDLVGLFMKYNKIVLDQPIYVGFTVLELSKMLMFDFYYNHLMPCLKPDESVEVIYTDTDSLLLNVTTQDLNRILRVLQSSWLDCSNMPPDHPLFSVANKGVLGKFKDEMDWLPIKESVALKPKCYAIKLAGDDTGKQTKKRAKGIVKSVVRKTIHYEDYIKTLTENKPQSRDMVIIQSREHQLYTMMQTKKSLSTFDNKRFWLPDNSSLPYGHYKILDIQESEKVDRSQYVKAQELITRAEKEKKYRKPYKRRNDIAKLTTEDDIPAKRVKQSKITDHYSSPSIDSMSPPINTIELDD